MLTTPLYIVGAGSFAVKLATMLQTFKIDVYFIDEFNEGPLLGRNVCKASEANQTDLICLIAISHPEYARKASKRLIGNGFSGDKIYSLLYESTINVLEIMLEHHFDKTLHYLNAGVGCFTQLEADVLQQIAHPNNQSLEVEKANRLKIGFYYIGKGGGFRNHVADLPHTLSKSAEVREFSDQKGHSTALNSYTIMSEQSMIGNNWPDLVINPHFFECSPRHIPKVTMMHMMYDFLVYRDLVAKVMNQADRHFLFVPSLPSMQLHQNICSEFNLSNNMVIVPGGYPRFDINLLKYQQAASVTKKQTSIIYAPTLSAVMKATETRHTYSIFDALNFIPALLEEFPDLDIIFRPHPDDLASIYRGVNTKRAAIFKGLLKICSTHSRMRLDDNPSDYVNTFAQSCALISDTSAIAFSYAVMTHKPVVFYSNNQAGVMDTLPNVAYIRDRIKLGDCVDSTEELISSLKNAFKRGVDIGKIEFCDQILFNKGTSIDYFKKNIEYFLSDEKHPEWWYWRDYC